jgi:TatD DNase family protein
MPRRDKAGLRFIDSHSHLGDYVDPGQVLSFASSTCTLIVTAGTDVSNSLHGVSLSREHPELVRAFVGVHPSEAEQERDLGWLEGALREAAGVGEVGLDPKYSAVDRGSPQMKLLLSQLDAAENAGKPVQMHSRGAERECLDALETFSLKKVLLHWFQGEKEVAEADGRGYYVSFGPALLVSKKLQRMAKVWGRDRIVVESDGPVRFAALGGVGGSWLIPTVVFKLAELFSCTFEETRGAILRNGLDFQDWKGISPERDRVE